MTHPTEPFLPRRGVILTGSMYLNERRADA